ncbi:glycosyl transferase [Aureococcus anophagefferens]|uniref:Glycosyl transferase n=1 Tax=Aureococcus anophagefferens TaxID=44056 RepID=A0ABR1FUJ6_AURAN
MNKIRLAHVALFFAAGIYSGYNVLLAASLKHLSPVTFSLCRELVAIPLLYAWASRAEAPVRFPATPREWRYMASFGVVLGLFQLCFAVGVAWTSPTAAALFQCVEPSTAAVIGAAVGLEPCTLAKLGSAVLAGGGVALLQLGGAAPPPPPGPRWRAGLGSCLLFCQGVGIATYCLLQKQLVRGDDGAASDDDDDGRRAATRSSRARAREPWGPVTLTAHACVGSCVVMACAAVVDGAAGLEAPAPLAPARRASPGRRRSPLAYAAVLSSVVGYSLRAWANRHVDAATLVLYNAVQPPLTALVALALAPGSSTYGAREGGATALVVLAVAVAAREKQGRGKGAREGSVN